FYAYNNQFLAARTAVEGGTALFNVDEQAWVHAGDVRLEATYALTKSFSLAVGWELLYFGNGIGRGVGPETEQDAALTGVTFGFKCNR
ncbi:MAG: hypothetical protein GTO53_14740, partial [Planctomycetales bacterium]|nr:hypothetical protein [Planctomycetales bacterium]NIM10340.1 hypothetical protein [Planctomycetales bacterium]NIN08887.1 hypothetical protein [Planctomycetales bacterium]NIN78002.1 hypothetical protein [Planctomycetales bacterium]NIO35190.1 hypothetical protein [Planctomycetales bacterium]